MHGMEVDYYKKLFQTIGNILDLIEKDDMPKYLLFLENAFPYMDNYNSVSYTHLHRLLLIYRLFSMPAFVRALFIKSSTNVELSYYIKRKSR